MTCTGLSERAKARGDGWWCSSCRPEEEHGRGETTRLPGGACNECGRTRRPGQGVQCRNCKCLVHKKCAGVGSRVGLSRMETVGWECSRCKEEVRLRRAEGERLVAAEDLQGLPVEEAAGLRVMQWNCDHLQSKVAELECFLEEKGIDVACLQETKLRAEDGDIQVRGFDVVRKDRCRASDSRRGRGGGLVTLIRKGLPYQVLPPTQPTDGHLSSVEIKCTQILLNHRQTWNVANVYIPPVGRSEESRRVALDDILRLPGGPGWLILGDLNAHHEWWDNHAARDQRGDWVTEWAEAKRLSVLNDGEVTRVERGSGRTSTPDVSVCHEDKVELCRWQVHRALGSDHFPMVIDVGQRPDRAPKRKKMVWCWNKADWEEYRDEIRRQLAECEGEWSVTEFEERLRRLILKAAWKHVGMKMLKTSNSEFLNAEVRKEMEKRDELKKNWPEQVAQVQAQEEKVRKVTAEKKAEEWKRMVKKNSSYQKMWGLLNRLKGGKRKDENGKVLSYRGKGYASDKAKANAFASEYAAVSKCVVPKWARRTKAMNAAALRRRCGPDTSDSQDITLAEVEGSLRRLDGSKAAGPDHIHPRLLKELPTEALVAVRRLFNMSFSEGRVPQTWRLSRIVPLLKKGKDSSEISSYRPISLTSVLGKWLERILTDRLAFVVEKNGLLSHFQAGFRRNRSVEDQLLRLTQDVSDGFHQREKTVLALFDFAKAYDKVWRDGLITKLLALGCSVRLVRWVQAWLANRKARVTVNQTDSDPKLLRQGLPQGSVMSPLLFLVFINDLLIDWPEDVEVSAFADDVAVWARSRSLEGATERVQKAAEKMEKWCDDWLMELSVAKCEVAVFSMDAKDSTAQPVVKCKGQELSVTPHPTFLGVTFDRRLSFGEHVKRLVCKTRTRLRILRALAGTTWGFGVGLMRATYVTLIRPVMEYGASAWMPRLCKTDAEKLEGVQREAARVIAGLVTSTPVEAVLHEAGLDPLTSRGETWATIAMERSLRLEEHNPRMEMAKKTVRPRLKKTGWREKASVSLEERLGSIKREAFPAILPPWLKLVEMKVDVAGERSDGEEGNLQLSRQKLADNPQFDVVLYTDGSVAEGGVNGGAAVVVTQGPADDVEVLEELERPAGRLCSSYQAEMVAIREGLRWLVANRGAWRKARVVTDSKSALESVARYRWNTNNVCLMDTFQCLAELYGCGRKLVFTWVPSHCGLPGNEMADAVAGQASTLDQAEVPLSFEVTKAAIWRRKRVDVLRHERSRRVYGDGGVNLGVEDNWTRAEGVSFRRFRSGHSLELASYRKRLGLQDCGLCRRCGLEDEDVEHVVVRCLAGEQRRRALGIEGLRDLCVKSDACKEYWGWFRGARDSEPCPV